MIELGVWKKIRRTEKPKDRQCVRYKWVFKLKRNGICRAQLVACGYSQIAGIDFTENFAGVINDVTYQLMFIMQLVKGYRAILIDIETAFLNGDLDEEIYMDIPQGM